MWKITNITAHNICSFRNLELEPKQGLTTLIFGQNQDNDSQGSNGSGKSALIEAISIALTGEPLRKANTEEIINDSQEQAFVSATMSSHELGTRLTINRKISRGKPQTVQILRQVGSYDAELEEVTQASVADYNKYILTQLGVSKEDLYNTFILCKHKYQPFLLASDREKKELINRFSNGIMVDECLEMVREDIEAERKVRVECDMAVSNLNGRITALREQTEIAKAEKEHRAKKRMEVITAHEESIAKYRGNARQLKDSINELKNILALYDDADEKLTALEEQSIGTAEAYPIIQNILGDVRLKSVSDYPTLGNKIAEEVSKLRMTSEASNVELTNCEKELGRCAKVQADLEEHFEKFKASQVPDTIRLKNLIGESRKLVAELSVLTKEQEAAVIEIEGRKAAVMAELAGTIRCPKCNHQFVLADKTPGIEIKKRLTKIEHELAETTKLSYANRKRYKEAKDTISESQDKLEDMSLAVEKFYSEVQDNHEKLIHLQTMQRKLHQEYKHEKAALVQCEEELQNLRQSMFDEAFKILDEAIDKASAPISGKEAELESALKTVDYYIGAIDELKASSEECEIEKLTCLLKESERKLDEAMAEQRVQQDAIDRLKGQEVRFAEFKTHLANSKVAALARLTNEFLEAMGSDIRIAFSGFTTLRNGKIREKISVSLLRDGIDCGNFGKFSAGEQCRVNLASILALHKLKNITCEDGKGLDLLVLDEILDATDEAGLSAMFEALNNLKITSLIVSHGNIAENYPHRITITKQNGISTINDPK